MDAGLLIARVVFGTLMAAHATQKLFGWLGGYGLNGTAGFFESLGFRPGRLFVVLAGGTELVSGLLLALGLLGPIGAAMMVSVMIVAAATVHWGHGLFAGTNGVEVPVLYAAAAAGLALTGPGAYSLDAAFGLLGYWTPAVSLTFLGLGVLGAVANLALRRTAQQPVTA